MPNSVHRATTRQIRVGSVPIGGGASVSIQTMTTHAACEVAENLSQISLAHSLGCDIVRVALRDEEELDCFARIVEQSPLPVIADVHFHHRLAIRALEHGAAAVRVNPGNLGGKAKFVEVLKAASDYERVVRIGVNSGSMPKKVVHDAVLDMARAMVDTARRWIGWAEEAGFELLKVSLKSSSVPITVRANRLYAKEFLYPLHVGLTESGVGLEAIVLSSAAIGSLLVDGIGDTIRMSLAGGIEEEVLAARRLLVGLGLRDGVRIIACPGCGRQHFDVGAVARKVESSLARLDRNLTIAVMGCEVNGPGEAAVADFGIVGGNNGFIFYASGKKVGISTNLDELITEILSAKN